MWDQFDGRPYTRDEFRAHVAALSDEAISWVKLICLHNTSAPNIEQWTDGPAPATRIVNLEHYYEVNKGWHSGPHGFIPPHPEICIYGFTPFTERGVHASCFNKLAWGLEMVGDFDVDSFDEGHGRLVHENAVFVLATLYHRLGLRPDGFELGKSGLHFHVDCARDNHACPGKHVKREILVPEVLFALHEMEGGTFISHEPIPEPPPVAPTVTATHQPAPAPQVAPSPIQVAPETPKPALETPKPAPQDWKSMARDMDELSGLGSRIAASLMAGGNSVRALLVTMGLVGGGASVLPQTSGVPNAANQVLAGAHPLHLLLAGAFGAGLIIGGIALWHIHRASRGLISAANAGRYTAPLEKR
jgi:hypothetical protein